MSKSLQAAVVAVALTGFIGGCFFSQTWSTGAVSSSTSWSIDEPGAVPGIASGTLTQVTLTKDSQETYFTVWSDLTNGGAGGGGMKGNIDFAGSHGGGDGLEVDFEATMNDGGTATVTIAGVRYDVAKGGLFLVSTQGGQPQVAQLNVDVRGLAFLKGEHLKKLAESTEETRRFFVEHQKVEATTEE